MHSSNSHISNKSIQKRRLFTHKRCSPPHFSAMWLPRQRQDGRRSCSLAPAHGYSWDRDKVADAPQPAFPIPEPETMKNNDGQTPKIVCVVLPAFCTAGLDCGQQCLAQDLYFLGRSFFGSGQKLLPNGDCCVGECSVSSQWTTVYMAWTAGTVLYKQKRGRK